MMRRRLATSLAPASLAATVALTVVALPLPAQSATKYVNRTGDSSLGSCNPSLLGGCTLREAVIWANNHSGPDTILLPEGTYRLSRSGEEGTFNESVNDLDVREDLVIQGQGAGRTIIDGHLATRLFDVRSGTLILRGLTLRNGRAETDEDRVNRPGGAVHVNLGATLVLESVVVTTSEATHGGGVYVAARRVRNGVTYNGGTLVARSSLFTDNYAVLDGGGITNGWAATLENTQLLRNRTKGNGGGIASVGIGAHLEVTGGIIADNTALGYTESDVPCTTSPTGRCDVYRPGLGGGLYDAGSEPSRVDRTQVRGNRAEGGAGIYVAGDRHAIYTRLHVHQNAIHDYAAQGGHGGGIATQGYLELVDSTVEYNTGGKEGGGIWAAASVSVLRATIRGNAARDFGGGLILWGYPSSIIESAIVGNTSGSYGGGVYHNGDVTLRNTTVSGNQAMDSGGGTFTGIGTLKLENASVAQNAPTGATLSPFGYIEMTMTIVAGNATQCLLSGGLITHGHNIASDDSCALTGAGDRPGTDALLGPLQDNGGLTLTHAPAAASPAIDGGRSANCPATDQRGYARPKDGNHDGVAMCDIGAVEFIQRPFTPHFP